MQTIESTPGDRGGVIVVKGGGGNRRVRRRDARIHVGPAPGVCTVDPELGCGYCLGVPCRHPATGEEDTPDGEDQ